MNTDNQKTTASPSPPSPRAGRGFTMIELLVVMFVISMLLVIGVPAAIKFRTQAKINDCRVTVNIIDKAVDLYHKQHKRYPSIHEMAGKLIGQSFTVDANGVATEIDDYHPGPGYRLVPRGTVYGPWNGVDKLKRSGDREEGGGAPGSASETARVQFIDAFGSPIWYCPFERPTATSEPTYTDSGFDKDDTEHGVNITGIADYATDALGRFYRRDYIIMSQSANGKWGLIRGTSSAGGSGSAGAVAAPTDDVTNFTKD